ncbi:MAG: hypothetical protein ACOX9E_13625 [Lentisphaeria bacterium]
MLKLMRDSEDNNSNGGISGSSRAIGPSCNWLPIDGRHFMCLAMENGQLSIGNRLHPAFAKPKEGPLIASTKSAILTLRVELLPFLTPVRQPQPALSTANMEHRLEVIHGRSHNEKTLGFHLD